RRHGCRPRLSPRPTVDVPCSGYLSGAATPAVSLVSAAPALGVGLPGAVHVKSVQATLSANAAASSMRFDRIGSDAAAFARASSRPSKYTAGMTLPLASRHCPQRI